MNQLIEAATLAEFKWKFRDGAIWAAQNHSPAGGVDAVRVDVLGRLGIVDLPFGPGVEFVNNWDLNNSLVTGTVLSQGDPVSPRFCVQVLKGHTLTYLLGERTAFDYRRPMLVMQMPGVERPAWLDEEPRSNEHGRIETFKRDVMTVGWEAKRKWGWCGDFETVMRRMGFAL